MKKITGKVVSLVLALALVVTSFSATFAFASTKTVSGTADFDTDKIYLVNGSTVKDSQGSVQNLNADWLKATLETIDHTDASGVEVSAISHASGDTLVKWNIDDNGEATLTLKSASKSGTEVLSILVKGTYNDEDGNEITVKAKKNFTVHVLDKDDYYVAKTGQTSKVGKALDELDTFAQTAGSHEDFSVYQAVNKDQTAVATYQTVNAQFAGKDDTGLTADVQIEVSNKDSIHTVPAADKTFTAYVGKDPDSAISATTKYKSNASVGSITFTMRKVVDGKASSKSADKFTTKTSIEKKVDTTALTLATSYTIKKDGGSTILSGIKNSHLSDKDAAGKDVVVTGAEVVFDNAVATVTVDEKTNVKKISGTVGKLSIGDATVGSVDLDAGEVALADGRVGDIATKASEVTISSGKAGNITVKDSGVTINGGTVGDVTTKDDKAAAGDVTVVSNDDETPIVVGTIKAPGVTATSDESKITIAAINVSKKDGTVKLTGKDVVVKAIDLGYYDTTLTLGDSDNEFVGSIPAPKNGDNAAFITENEDTVAAVSGDVKLDSISLATDSSVTFDGKVNVGSIDGDGNLTVGAGKLYIGDSASGATLKLTGELKAGDTAYTAKADAVGEEDLNNYGFTVKKSAGNSIDTFKIATLKFAGLQTNKTSAKIAKDYSEIFTASAYPAGTAIPADATIDWTFDGNEDVFQVTKSGSTATVKVLKVDPDFASENAATLTAKLVDANGDEIEDYAPAKIALTAIAVPEAVSDTTKDITVNGSYTFKITSTTAPTFSIGSAGVFSSALVSKNGNDYFYKITATGKVGDKAGIYLNGAKLLVATVGAPAFKSDTTSNVTVKGAYTYKITAAAVPTFSIGTAGVFTAQFVSKSGNDYFYKITSVGKAGANAGIYVNGVKVNVATVG